MTSTGSRWQPWRVHIRSEFRGHRVRVQGLGWFRSHKVTANGFSKKHTRIWSLNEVNFSFKFGSKAIIS